MATYLQCVPDNHILVIISLYVSSDTKCSITWNCLTDILNISNRKDSYEMRKYLIQQMAKMMSRKEIHALFEQSVKANYLIGAQIALDSGVRDSQNIR